MLMKLILVFLKTLWFNVLSITAKGSYMSTTNQFNKWNIDCSAAMKDASDKVDAVIEPVAKSFRDNTLDSIPIHFGKFLATSLGDYVNSTRTSKLNKDVVNNVTFLQHVSQDIITAGEDAIVAELSNGYGYYSSGNRPQLYITTGTGFGVSYIANNKGRVSTINFGDAHLFEYLTQLHVDMIKNKRKRECTQQFLDFRDQFVDGATALSDAVIPIRNFNANLAVVTKINASKCYGHSYYDSKYYRILDDVITIPVTHMVATINPPTVWDKSTPVSTDKKQVNSVDKQSYISLSFYSVDEEIVPVCNIDIDCSEKDHTKHTLMLAQDISNSSVIEHLNSTRNHRLDKIILVNGTKHIDNPKGMIMNMDDLLQHPTVRDELQKRISFYGKMSSALQAMKHENADLYFVNADI